MEGRQGRFEDGFGLGRNFLGDIGFEPAEEEWAEDFVELIHDSLVRGANVEEMLKGGGFRENVGVQKVEESPQLTEVVLKRRAGDEETTNRIKRAKHGGKLRSFIFEAVGLVDGQQIPRVLSQGGFFNVGDLVRSHNAIEIALSDSLSELGSLFLGRVESEDVDFRAPSVEFNLPGPNKEEKKKQQKRNQFCSVLSGAITRNFPGFL